MKSALMVDTQSVADIEFQEASLDIWDKKYRLKSKDGDIIDQSMDATYCRVARALADVENEEIREHWYDRFVWALRHGAVPAGRIMSNAGAQEHKPATSTINCTVSGTVGDSMHDILDKVHEAGLTLKAGCGIGYEFSTLRPKGAYVSGAGAYTSGPLSFMDIYDRMCFTVSSAGGRRGAQMGTFDVGHPDVMDFVLAKREDGRLRQFNLSLLVTDEFMQAVRDERDWQLAFPIDAREIEGDASSLSGQDDVVWREWPAHAGYVTNGEGLVACRVYRTLPARRLWDVIMTSTYDFAEPGFVLIDRVNELNNNWFDENIRATNPCVTADTWVQTDQGPRSVSELTGSPFNAVVNGMTWRSTSEGFFSTGIKPVVRLRTTDGFEVKLTRNHRVQRVARFADGQMETDWCEAGSLRSGDRVVLNDHRSRVEWAGKYGSDEGYLAGVLVASGGSVSEVDAGIAIYREPVAANAPYTPIPAETKAVMSTAMSAARRLGQVSRNGWESGLYGREYHLSVPCIGQVARELRLVSSPDPVTAEMERTSSEFHSGFLRAWFDLCGRVIAVGGRPEIDLAVPESMPDSRATLRTLQRMLLRLGVVSHIRRESEPSGWRLVVDATALSQFADVIGFSSQERRQQLAHAMSSSEFSVAEPRYVSQVGSISACGVEEVYDCQIPGVNAFDANGVMAHNCGEQPLPPYGSCLLGSINLTRFVHAPFSDAAEFDWDQFREVVKVFTRMLDNVVEINGLPLAGQRSEITRKRRHGMGFLGLGSTLALLCMRYGSKVSVEFTERVARELAIAGWETALELAGEKGAAPIMHEEFDVTPAMLRQRPEMVRDGYQVGDRVPGRILHAHYSRYMQRVAAVAPDLVERLAENGGRFTHHSSIAPTGTISLSLANNASNGIEPSFAHHYFRNVIREGRKTKEKVGVFSFELLAYRQLVNEACMPESDLPEESLPDYFAAADDIKPREHVDIQAAAQKWVDSSISKTANVPTEFPYEEFKDIYLYAYEQGLKGCTTFRFNPEAFQGVLVKEQDLKNTKYTFQLDNGEEVTLTGDEEVEYDGEVHTAANLFDALKEGYYGKF